MNKQHLLHPWHNFASTENDQPTIIAKAKGVHVWDNKGNQFLDGIGGMWCVTLGYGNEELANVMKEQAMQLAYYTPFGDMSNNQAATLSHKLASLSPRDLNTIHFTNSGSTAIDSAIRFVHYYFQTIGKKNKKIILSRHDAYHGSTYLGSSLSRKEWDRTNFIYEDKIIHHLKSPNYYRNPKFKTEEEFCDYLLEEARTKIQDIGADNIACFIAEPILASGGVIVPPKSYHQKMNRLMKENDILYISDEVVTGFGRLGHFFASEVEFGIVPDLIITAKGISSGYAPLGAVLISDRLIKEVQKGVSNDKTLKTPYFTNGFTYSGHPICCAVALKNIEIMENTNLLQHVQEIGPYFIKKLQELKKYSIIGDVRGQGLMACVECRVDKTNAELPTPADMEIAYQVDKYCEEAGLLVRPYESLCILSPPLIISKKEIDTMIQIIENAIVKTMNTLKL